MKLKFSLFDNCSFKSLLTVTCSSEQIETIFIFSFVPGLNMNLSIVIEAPLIIFEIITIIKFPVI